MRARGRRVRRYTFLSLLLLALSAPAGWVAANETTSPYIVLFDGSSLANAAKPAVSGRNTAFRIVARPAFNQVDGERVVSRVRVMSAQHGLRVSAVYDNAVAGFAARMNANQARAVANDPSVVAVMRDEPIQLDDATAGREAGGVRTTANPGNRIPAGVRRVGARNSTVLGVRGSGGSVDADVAILDTGVQRNHPDLNVVGGYNCTGGKRDKWDDSNGHGTHVAGTVGAMDNRIGVVGVAPGVRLWSVKVLNANGSGYLSWMVCGIDWVTAQRQSGAPARPMIEVANMSISFGGASPGDRDCVDQRRDALHSAICRSVARGTTYVVAAGNEGRNARHNRPASFDEVITVSAMADFDGRAGGRAGTADACPYYTPEQDDAFAKFSNFGPDVDLIAPGRCVLSTYTRGRYAWMSGTSMATPHVSGAAAIYRSLFPRATPGQVRQALQAVGTFDWRTKSDPDGNPEPALWLGAFRAMPDFTVSATRPATAVSKGTRFSVNVSVSCIGGFDDPITVTLAEAAGFRAVESAVGDGGGQLNVRVRNDAESGEHLLTVRARGGDVERTTTIRVTVAGPVVDRTPPRAPSVSLDGAEIALNLDRIGVDEAYVGHSGMLWVRAGVSGSVELVVQSRDAESGIASYHARVAGNGWRASWVGGSQSGVLRLAYSGRGNEPATLTVTAVNGAGLESDPTVGQLMRDGDDPTAVRWDSAPTDSTRTIAGSSFRLDWSGGTDDGSGLSRVHVVRRYRAPLRADGTFNRRSFSADGDFKLVRDGAVETNLQAGYVYVWSVRTLDNVGNYAPSVVSGYVVVKAR